MKKRYYLAYGSNLNLRQMDLRCPNAEIVGTAWIPDHELLFKGSKTGSYLTIEPKHGSRVPVAVWAVTAADEAALDRYEGYPTFYYKKELTLPVSGFRFPKRCFVYIMHEERKLGIPSLSYVQTCLQGYDDLDFDESYLIEALIKSAKGANA